MPKTTVEENGHAPTAEHNIGAVRQGSFNALINPKAIPHAMQARTKSYLHRGIASANPLHAFRGPRRRRGSVHGLDSFATSSRILPIFVFARM
jgi:hypothetical protein